MAKTTISRRTVLTLLAATGTATVVGCERTRRQAPAANVPIPDALVVDIADGLGLLRGDERQSFPGSLPAADGSVIHATAPDGGDTAFWRVDTATGRTSARITLPGRWLPQAVSASGTTVALTSDAVNVTDGRPEGRNATPLMIVDGNGVPRRLELPGNYVPETFTEDLTGLFVLEWLPPTSPDRYRVRVVDLATTQPGPLFTRDKGPVPVGAEEEMRGEGRQAVMAPDRSTLYTLYTHQPGHRHTRDLVSGRPGHVHAFVHTLHLTGRWAFCVDLPNPFGAAPGSGHAIAITPDGGRLVVVDATSGTAAEISTQDLTVRRTVRLPSGIGTAHAAADRARLFVGVGTTVRTMGLADLGPTGEWQVREPVTGLVPSPDGRRLYVGQTDSVSWHDPATGAELGRVPVPGLVTLRGLVAGA
ncbi:YncE family protein [Micromonospora sp. WMMD558]|uniref:YncE family protein n=1 Tax=Micromonospora sp. WMMD558 TaxID=3403462 RepID=UPI003BF53F70